MGNPVLDAARTKRTKHMSKLDGILAPATAESRSLTDDETTEFEALSAKITKLDAEIELHEAHDVRMAAAESASATIVADAPGVIVRSEPKTYAQYGTTNSYLRDLAAIQVPQAGFDAEGAQERMARHAREIEVEARRDSTVAARWREAGLEARTNPNTTAGTGGEFVPPLWMVNSYIPAFRPGRMFANRINNQPLPPGIDVINIPKILTGSTTAIQTANAASVSSTDITTSTVSGSVNTIAGQQDISLQLLEQSPISMDGVVFQDLAADYDQRLDLQVISGTGASGQHLGVLSITQSATPTAAQVYYASVVNATPKFYGAANSQLGTGVIPAVNNIETTRFANATGIWVHPRRANAFGAAQDTTGRPMFVRPSHGAFNALGIDTDSPQFQAVAGELYGLPVIKDANMPSDWISTVSAVVTTHTTGATAQDVMLVLKEDDIYLWEGPLRLRVLPEVSSGTLAVRLQAYAYSAFMPNRTPTAISMITGPALQTSILGY